jgi:hypothetical protein
MPEFAGVATCFGLVLGLLVTLAWVYAVLRALAALELFARSHAELAHAVHRAADALSAKGAAPPPSPVEADWRNQPPDVRPDPAGRDDSSPGEASHDVRPST